ncbi:MAG: class I SAM-dependent methyltransferase [Verrucomicrobiales bacterium]|nr:class I SAM-dependent methyltransferase [Verrucomicrobiales bacterium]
MILDAPPTPAPTSEVLAEVLESLHRWVQVGGPRPEQYGDFRRLIRRMADGVRGGEVAQQPLHRELQRLASGPLRGALQSQALLKPHGHAGDFEIIDAIHTLRVSEVPQLRRWDLFFQAQAAPVAVRNRKIWFHQLLSRRISAYSSDEPLRVLNVGSGPARDVWEWMLSHPSAPIQMDCVDLDAHAISFSESLCGAWSRQIHFHHQNILKSLPGRGYDLIWCAGLFDYLTDRVATRLLRALLGALNARGTLTVGNFSPLNPSRDYMEVFGDWNLHHRSETELKDLATHAGADPRSCGVDWEPTGVNLFLRIGAAR